MYDISYKIRLEWYHYRAYMYTPQAYMYTVPSVHVYGSSVHVYGSSVHVYGTYQTYVYGTNVQINTIKRTNMFISYKSVRQLTDKCTLANVQIYTFRRTNIRRNVETVRLPGVYNTPFLAYRNTPHGVVLYAGDPRVAYNGTTCGVFVRYETYKLYVYLAYTIRHF